MKPNVTKKQEQRVDYEIANKISIFPHKRVGRSRRKVAVEALIVLVCCCVATTAQAEMIAGTVIRLDPSASVQRAGNLLDVAVGMSVDTGDRIIVNSGGKIRIALSGGSIINGGSMSVFVLDEELLGPGGAAASTKIGLFAGILRSIVKGTSSGAPPNFQVHTPNAIISVRGTKFDTAYSEGVRRFGFGDCTRFTDIRSYEGRVGARNAALPSSEETTIGAGYETTIACDSPPLSPGPLGMTGMPFSDVGTFVGEIPGAEVAPPAGVPALPPIGGKGP